MCGAAAAHAKYSAAQAYYLVGAAPRCHIAAAAAAVARRLCGGGSERLRQRRMRHLNPILCCAEHAARKPPHVMSLLPRARCCFCNVIDTMQNMSRAVLVCHPSQPQTRLKSASGPWAAELDSASGPRGGTLRSGMPF